MSTAAFLGVVRVAAGKDWKLFWADRRAAALCFLVPVVLASAFGVIFDRPREANPDVRLPLLVVLESDGAVGQQIAADLLACPRIHAELATREQANARVADRRPGVAVVIPAAVESLTAWVPGTNQTKPKFDVLHDPTSRNEAQWAEGVVAEVVMKRLAKLKTGAAVEMPFATAAAPATSGFNSYAHSFSGMAVQYLLFWGMESGLLLLRERQRGVWRRLLASPASPPALFLGRGVATAVIALLQVAATFAAGNLLFGVRATGSAIGFAVMAVAVSVLAAGTGLLVAAVGGTEARGRSLSIVVILAVAMVGGLWLPAFLLPGWVRDAGFLLPTSWAMKGLDAATGPGRGFGQAVASGFAVLAFAILFLTAAVVLLCRAETRRRKGWA